MSIITPANMAIALIFITICLLIVMFLLAVFKLSLYSIRTFGLGLIPKRRSFRQEHNRQLVKDLLPVVIALTVLGYCYYNSYFFIMTIIVLLTTVQITKKAIA